MSVKYVCIALLDRVKQLDESLSRHTVEPHKVHVHLNKDHRTPERISILSGKTR